MFCLENILLNELDNSNDWTILITKYQINENILYKFKNKIDWELACQFQRFSEKFIEEHIDLFSWSMICFYQPLSKEFIMKHINDIEIGWLAYNTNISTAIKDKIFKYLEEHNERKFRSKQ